MRKGFEPLIRFITYTRFPGVLLKPLGHLSKCHSQSAGTEVKHSARQTSVARLAPKPQRQDTLAIPQRQAKTRKAARATRAGARARKISL